MKKKINPLFATLAIPLVVVVASAILLISRGNASGNAQPIPPAEVLRESPETLRGNVYTLQCVVEQQLAYDATKGRILAVKYWGGNGRAAVFVPVSIGQNFEVGQRYTMRVRVNDDTLFVEELEKF